MDRPGQDVLAGARFARDQHRGIHFHRLTRLGQGLQQGRGISDDVLKTRRTLLAQR